MVTIIFEAHGTTFDNEQKVSSGHDDAELSPLGEQQAQQLGERHREERIDVVYVSDLQRAYRTAEIAFSDRDVPIIRDVRLREVDYGNLTRHPSSEVESRKGEFVTTPFPNGESYEQAAQRMKSFLFDLLERYDGKRVMIIGHRATQYGLEHWISGVPLSKAVTAPWSWQSGWTYHLEHLDG